MLEKISIKIYFSKKKSEKVLAILAKIYEAHLRGFGGKKALSIQIEPSKVLKSKAFYEIFFDPSGCKHPERIGVDEEAEINRIAANMRGFAFGLAYASGEYC